MQGDLIVIAVGAPPTKLVVTVSRGAATCPPAVRSVSAFDRFFARTRWFGRDVLLLDPEQFGLAGGVRSLRSPTPLF